MLMFGLISEIDQAAGLVRVNFDEDEIVSGFIPVAVLSSKATQFFQDLELNSHVACLMDERCENGVVIGAIYDAENKPTRGAANVTSLKFKDGAFVEYNAETHVFEIKVSGSTYLISQNGFAIKRADETLKKILADILAEIKKITVNTPSGTSAIPNNVAEFEAIIARLPNLFTE